MSFSSGTIWPSSASAESEQIIPYTLNGDWQTTPIPESNTPAGPPLAIYKKGSLVFITGLLYKPTNVGSANGRIVINSLPAASGNLIRTYSPFTRIRFSDGVDIDARWQLQAGQLIYSIAGTNDYTRRVIEAPISVFYHLN
jgi:hypothetical protein